MDMIENEIYNGLKSTETSSNDVLFEYFYWKFISINKHHKLVYVIGKCKIN